MSFSPANLLNTGYTVLFTVITGVVSLLFGYVRLTCTGREAFSLGLANLHSRLFRTTLTMIGIVVGVGAGVAVAFELPQAATTKVATTATDTRPPILRIFIKPLPPNSNERRPTELSHECWMFQTVEGF